MDSVVFTTAFIDIGRGEWKECSRSYEKYITQFETMMNHWTCDYVLIVYTHVCIIEMIRARRSYPSNILFMDVSGVETFLCEPYLTREADILKNPKFQSKIPDWRRPAPEHQIAKYTLLTHSKTAVLRHTRKVYPDYTYYAWLDFGYPAAKTATHNCPTRPPVPNRIQFDILDRKVHCGTIKLLPNHVTEDEFLETNYFTIYAFSFIVHTDIFDEYYTLYVKKLEDWQCMGHADDEQNLLYQLYQDRKDMFKMFKISEPWGLYTENLNASASPCILQADYKLPKDVLCSSVLNLNDCTKPIVLCWDTNARDVLDYMRSLEKQGWEYIFCIENVLDDSDAARMRRIHALLNALPASKQVVLARPSYETLCSRSPMGFMKAVAMHICPLIVGMTASGKHISRDVYWIYHDLKKPSARPFIHAGVLTGTASRLQEFLMWSMSTHQTDLSAAMACYMAVYPNRVAADYDANIFEVAPIFEHTGFFLQFPNCHSMEDMQRMYKTVLSSMSLIG